MPRTFVMAGGGTGGHVLPALAVARELRARGHQVRFVGVRARHGSQAGSRREFSHRVDRDRRLEPRRLPADAGDAGRACRSACGKPRAFWIAPRRRRCFRWAAMSRGRCCWPRVWKRIPDRHHGAQRHSRFHAPASGALRDACAGELRRSRALVSEGPRRSHRAAHSRRIFRGAGRSRAVRSSRC